MDGFKRGDRVDITAKNIEIHQVDTDGTLWYVVPANTALYRIPPDATVTRSDPEHWPPVPGDVWVDREGDAWIVTDRDGPTEMVTAGAHSGRPDDVLTEYAPLRLIHRPGVDL